jgi:uncharacterized protein (UPF0548 family)
MDQRPARAPVAVDEGVDRLELGVGDGGLRHGGQAVVVGEGAEVLDQARDVVRRRGDERSGARVEAAATNPVLHLP